MAPSIPKYRETKPTGKCEICTINLWAEHGNAPAPHTMPCPITDCPHKSSAKVLAFPVSSTGSSLANIGE